MMIGLFVLNLMIDLKFFGKVGVFMGGCFVECEILLMFGNGVFVVLCVCGVDVYLFDLGLQVVVDLVK